MSDTECVHIGFRIEMMPGRDLAQRLVGAARAQCSFAAVPRQGERIAVANLILGEDGALPAETTGLPIFIEVAFVEHFTSGPGDTGPECWAVARMTAPARRETCDALVAALGSRGWALDAFRDGHPFGDAVRAWRERESS